jgi:hypothetical protein
VIGRLLTDEEFRTAFSNHPKRAIQELIDRGTDLTAAEITALLSIDLSLWRRVATEIDPRLQKASFKNAE